MRLLWSSVLFGLATAAQGAPPPADALPTFKPGLWSFSLTANNYGEKDPKVRTMTRCADPAAEIRKKWQSLEMQACKFSPIAHTGNSYSYSSTCASQGRTVTIKSVIVVEKDDSYRVDTQSHTQAQASREIVVARRVGECPGAPAGTAPIKE